MRWEPSARAEVSRTKVTRHVMFASLSLPFEFATSTESKFHVGDPHDVVVCERRARARLGGHPAHSTPSTRPRDSTSSITQGSRAVILIAAALPMNSIAARLGYAD